MKRITSKLFETQSALSRQRFKLIQNLSDPMYETSPGIPEFVKKILLNQDRFAISGSKLYKKSNTYQLKEEEVQLLGSKDLDTSNHIEGSVDGRSNIETSNSWRANIIKPYFLDKHVCPS
jgi:hypothetical protein